MQLTAFTDYSLQVLIAVGSKGSQEFSTIPEIAERYGISRNHLIKIVHHLSQAGYLTTIRGKGGGFRLAMPAADICVGAVVRDTEQRFDLVPCFAPGNYGGCVIEPACVLKRALHKALDSFLSVLDDCTLADLLRPKRRLRSLLAAC